jgi:hypothetical protein
MIPTETFIDQLGISRRFPCSSVKKLEDFIEIRSD